MKLLVVDTFVSSGHNQFNTIQISALRDNGHLISLVGKKGHYPAEVMDLVEHTFSIPNFLFNRYYKNKLGSLWDDLWEIARLIYIRTKILNKEYDGVVFLRYNILVTLFFITSKPCYLFNHYSACELKNPIKKFVASLYPSNYIHLALNDYITDFILTRLPTKRVFTVQHGVLKPFKEVEGCSYIEKNRKFIFCSATSSCDKKLLNKIINFHELQDYMCKNDIIMLVKCNIRANSQKNIIIIRNYISNNDYKYLICKSECVILPYDESFQYRVSGVFFECVANNQIVISSSIPAFSTYSNNKRPLYLINNEYDLLSVLKSIHNKQKSWNLDEFSPNGDWKKVLKTQVQ